MLEPISTASIAIISGPEINPVPEDGDGDGVMLEALLNFDLTNVSSIGIGARYWRLQSDGTAHFEQAPVRGRPQVEDWDIERYGVFVQGKARF